MTVFSLERLDLHLFIFYELCTENMERQTHVVPKRLKVSQSLSQVAVFTFTVKLIKVKKKSKPPFHSHTSHISSAQRPQVATVVTSVLDRTLLEPVHSSLFFFIKFPVSKRLVMC